MPKLIGRGLASSMCNNINNIKSASRSTSTCTGSAIPSKTSVNTEKNLFYAQTEELNTQPILIPNVAMHEKIDCHPTVTLGASSALSMSPERGGPASLAFAATTQIALHLGEEHKTFATIPSHECILNNFTETTSTNTSASTINSTKRKDRKDPFVFDNFLPINDSSPVSSQSSSTYANTSSTLKKSKSFSRKRRSVTNLAEHDTAAPYPSSKVIRSGLKKSPSRYHLSSLNDQAESSTQDDILSFRRTSSKSPATSEQENLTPTPRAVTPSWGQFADLDAQEEEVLEF